MFNNNTVYECKLYSITPNIRVNKDWTKRKNIKNAIENDNIKVVKYILVQPTINKKYYREIVTGKLIPVYRKIRVYNYFSGIGGDLYTIGTSSTVFIKSYEKDFYSSRPEYFDLRLVSASFLRNYLEEHEKDDFKTKLDNIFQQGEEYYRDAAAKNNYSNETEVKSLLKSMKKRK